MSANQTDAADVPSSSSSPMPFFLADICPDPFLWHPSPSVLPNLALCPRLSLAVWAPALFFWALCPALVLQLWRVRKRAAGSSAGVSSPRPLPLSARLLAKFVLCLLLMVLAVAQLFKLLEAGDPLFSRHPVAALLAPVGRALCLLSLFLAIRLVQQHGLVSSGILHNSWLFQLICSLPELYTVYQNFFTDHPEPGTSDPVHSALALCWSLLLFAQFLLHFFADPRHPSHSSAGQSLLGRSSDGSPASSADSTRQSTGKPSPELDSSFVSRLIYHWFSVLPALGKRRDLTFDDLWQLNEGSQARFLVPQWEHCWLPAVEKYYQQRRQLLAQGLSQALLEAQKGGKASGAQFAGTKLRSPKSPSLVMALFKMFKWELLASGLIKLASDLLQFANPFLLKELITFVGAPDAQLWQGLALAFAMFACSQIRSLCVNHYFFIMFRMGIKIQTVLTSAIYRKSLQLSSSARRERTLGEIVNLMAIDTERFLLITAHIQQFWSSPLQIALALLLLFNTLGLAAIPGLVIMSVLIPLSFVSSLFTRRWQVKQMQLKDERSKLCNEILNGIKVIKLYAWEQPMMEAVERIRAKELGCLLKAGIVKNLIDMFNFTSPFLVAIGSFVTFCLVNPSALTPQVAFVALTLFNLIRSPMTMIGVLINLLVQTIVSKRRIQQFLVEEELDPAAVERMMATDPATATFDIRLRDADFAWETASPWERKCQPGDKKKAKEGKSRSATVANDPNSSVASSPIFLQGINLQVRQGQLVAIVGKVGSGKSSLLAALLGEMDKLRGSLQLRQGISLAYVPQQAWIQNMTVRRNITFGRPWRQPLYDQVLEACALKADLAILAQGDQTEIGEKGINLSGGQKARVALARALYQQSDIYLLDDPLSAVDSHVGRWIFDKVIGPEGMLCDRTRLLVTHQLHFLHQADQILLLDEGRIVERGSFEELSALGGKFAELLVADRESPTAAEIKEQEEKAEAEEETTEEEEEEQEMVEHELELTSPEQMDKMIRQHCDSDRRSSSPTSKPHCHRRRVHSNSAAGRSGSGRSQRSTASKPTTEGQKNGNGGGREGQLIEREHVETGRVKIAVYLIYMRAAGLLLSILFLAFYCANQGTQMVRNFWLSAWADENQQRQQIGAEGGNRTGSDFLDSEAFRLGVYAAFGIGEAIFFFLALLALLLGSLAASRNLHSPMLARVLRAPMAFFDTTPIGRLLNRFGKDIEVADTLLPMNVRYFVQCLTMVVATLGIICFSTWMFALLIVPLFLFYYYMLRLYVPTSRQLKRLESSHRSPIYSHFGESIQGATSIRAFGRQEDFCTQMERRIDNMVRIKYLSQMANRWLAVRLEFLGNCIVLFAALFGAFSRDWNLVASAGLVGLSVSYALNITEVMNFAIRQVSELETNIVSIERLKEYAEVETEAPWKVAGAEPPLGWPSRGEIRFADYSARYRPGLDLVLKNIVADIRPSEKVGIVGRTGAGKSSLTLALFRMIEPACGTIFIDGEDITKMGLHDLRSGLTIIPQDPVLFSGTLRFNLDPFGRHSDAEIWTALEDSHLHDFANQMPQGLDHQISEGGENISVGQRQLLCLARALLRQTRILVLDEATASVDMATDGLIQETIRQKFRQCTVFTIAHRLETIMDYDRVIVLHQGRIAEFDSVQALLANRGSQFAAMVADVQAQQQQKNNGSEGKKPS